MEKVEADRNGWRNWEKPLVMLGNLEGRLVLDDNR
jgi:hypothetical protein